MKINIISEILVSVILLIFIFLLINPFHLWMPDAVQMMMTLGIALAFILFASFVFHEKVHDEREALHRYIAARFAYLSGTIILVVALVVQSIHHTLDNWLLIALFVMILGKIIGFLWGKIKY